jgi:hypothetical protein
LTISRGRVDLLANVFKFRLTLLFGRVLRLEYRLRLFLLSIRQVQLPCDMLNHVPRSAAVHFLSGAGMPLGQRENRRGHNQDGDAGNH